MSNPDRVSELSIVLDETENSALLVDSMPLGFVPSEMLVSDAAVSMMLGTSLGFVEGTVSVAAIGVSD